MKTRFVKTSLLLIFLFVFAFSLTGCDSLDYREAVELYNAESYAEAAEIFALLEDYEDSDQLETRCYYRLALKAMEYGRYDAALEQFQTLGDYEDSLARITECKYQLAIASFDSGDLETAEAYFLEVSDYRQAAEYMRQINWQRLFNAIAEKAPAEAESVLSLEQDGYTIQVIARNGDLQELIFSLNTSKDMGFVFTDSFLLHLTREALQASFTAESSFSMGFKGGQIGSQQTGSGKLDIATCTADTPLALESFAMTVTDNQGTSTSSSDPADCLMGDAMAENFKILMDSVPGMLTESGITLTLAHIGFAALQ